MDGVEAGKQPQHSEQQQQQQQQQQGQWQGQAQGPAQGQGQGNLPVEEFTGVERMLPLPSEPTARTEVWGWWVYDFANNAFYAAALPVFFPLLLTTLANTQAYIELGQSAPPPCDASNVGPCLVCVPGLGTQLQTANGGVVPYPQPKVTAGALHIDPVAYATLAAGIAVLLQVITFITFGPLADYGRGRKNMLVVSTVLGSLVTVLCLTLVSPSLWWLAGVYLIVANVCYGLACVCWNSYLGILVDAHPEVLEASVNAKDREEELAVREHVSNKVSLTAVGFAALGGILAIVLSAGVTLTTPDPSLQLRLANATAGIFWLAFSLLAFHWLKARPGPPFPPGGLSPLTGWKQVFGQLMKVRKYKNTFLFLVSYFIYADGYITLTQIGVLYGQRVVCMSNLQLIVVVAGITFFGGIGALLFFWAQRWTGLPNKTMLVLALALMVPLPLWGLLGYATTSLGMRQLWEVYVFAVWFGLLLGPALSYTRTVFIDLIPVGSEATFFSLFSITDKGSSWMGPLITALVVQTTGDLRLSFIYILVVMVVPLFMLVLLVNHKQGMIEVGRTKEQSDLQTIES